MKSMKIAFVTLVAVFAISAVAVSSAAASPEWYVKKSGKWEKVTTAVKVTGNYNWSLLANAGGAFELGGLALTAEFAGELKSGGVALLNTMTNATGKVIKPCEALGPAEPHSFPWKLELYKEGTEVRSKILKGGTGEPEYSFTCRWSLYGEHKVTSKMNTTTKMTNLTSNVEAVFDTKSAKTECTYNGPCQWKGVFVTIKPPSGVEAIKVE